MVPPSPLPTLEQIRQSNSNKTDVQPETAWIWGEDDEIGRINLLTPERVAASTKQEVQDGSVISLNWDINLPRKPAFLRDPCKHRIAQHPSSPYIFDDWLDMNIQSGSQWDGFRHFGHLTAKKLYNNLNPSEVTTGTRCGIQAAANHGIVGRGVLLDHYGWALRNNRAYDPLTSHAIPLDELKAVAKEQNVEFQVGDILLIRSGYIKRYYELENLDPVALEKAGSAHPTLAGVEQSEEMKTWLHDCYFSAVGGDAPAFEVWPSKAGWYLHEYLLALWGVMIGEMFDLEALARACEERKRWSFLFMSAPMNIPGGIASLANALAMF